MQVEFSPDTKMHQIEQKGRC